MRSNWEYYVKDLIVNPNLFENGFPNDVEAKDLKNLGEKGWELVQIITYNVSESDIAVRYYYKRRKVYDAWYQREIIQINRIFLQVFVHNRSIIVK